MPAPDILTVCGTAFAATFVLLAFLAGMMRLLMFAFPGRGDQIDPATVAAVAAAVGTMYPGRKISRIETEK
jgi:hypothetical protein